MSKEMDIIEVIESAIHQYREGCVTKKEALCTIVARASDAWATEPDSEFDIPLSVMDEAAHPLPNLKAQFECGCEPCLASLEDHEIQTRQMISDGV